MSSETPSTPPPIVPDKPAANGIRLADRAYTAIVQIILDEQLAVGDRLPAEDKLATMFGMSRTIVREALARLASDGITQARRGAGSYVKRRPSERLGSHMPMADIAATLGTYEVRFVLEAEAARLAAQRRSHHQMDAIEHALEALRTALLSNAPAHDEDWVLHRAIAEATANAAFLIKAMMDEHDAIVEAIRAQDADGAALAMRWHLSQGRKRLMP
jgi:GntR family transcriptional repressor for pyruvate dehydrogenase complex